MGENKKRITRTTTQTIDEYLLGLYESYAPTDSFQSINSNSLNILNQDSNIWPGSILSGTNLQLGKIHEYALDRAPITLTNNVSNKSVTVQDPTDSTVATALASIQQFPSDGAQNFVYTISQSNYLGYFDAEFAFAGNTLAAEFGGSGGLTLSKGQSYLLYRLNLPIFNISMDPIRDASDFFTSEETVSALQSTLLPDDYPVVIDSLTYGRSLYLLIITSYDETTFNAALNFIYDGIKNGGSVNLNSSYRSMIDESTIFAASAGLSGEDSAGQVHSAEDLIGAFKSMINPKNPTAIPISFLTAKLTNSMAPIVVPTGLLSLTLSEITATAATEPPHGNYKVFGEVEVLYKEYASSSTTSLSKTSDLDSDPSGQGGYWFELEAEGDSGTIASDINKSCLLSYNGGSLTCYADIWDHFTGSSNEQIGTNEGTLSMSDILSAIQGLTEGETQFTYSFHTTSTEWGSIEISFTFDFTFIS